MLLIAIKGHMQIRQLLQSEETSVTGNEQCVGVLNK